jgi:peptidoglycan-associated lipoprotein
MDTQARNKLYALSAGFVLSIGLFSVVGCSQNTASNSPENAMEQEAPGTQKFRTSAQSTSSQNSSLDAHQEGTLGENAGPLRDVHFDFDRYDLSPDTKEILTRHAAWLNMNPQVSVEVEGHGDDRGTSEYNLALGAKRAASVKHYLVDLGIAADRMSTISYGEELPLCREQQEHCWAKNRRAHFVVRKAPTT